MRRLKFLIIALGASLLIQSSSFSEDSSDLFLNAYKDFQAAEKLEREAKPREAFAKYRSALQILQRISKSSPDWQPLVVDYRLRKAMESIIRLEAEVSNSPQATEAPEGKLPESGGEKQLAPVVSTVPVVTVKPPASANRNAPVRPIARADNPAPDRDSVAVEREVRELRRQLADARSENQSLNEQLQKRSAEQQSALLEVDKTKVNVVELKSQLAQATSSLEDMRKDGVSLKEIRQGLEKKYAAIYQQYSDLQADNEVLQEENARLLSKLERASKYIGESDRIRSNLLTERKELDERRDKAVAALKKIKDNSAEIERVTAENKQLKNKISEVSQTTVSKSEFEKLAGEKKALAEKLSQMTPADQVAEKDKAINSLQKSLELANKQLLEAKARVAKGEDQEGLLRKQLDEASSQLAQLESNLGEEKKIAMENELLRGIILRQVKEQTKRDEARKILEQEIVTSNPNPDVVRQQLAVVGAPVLQLTPEERSLFKDPVTLLTESNAQSLEVTVAISKPSSEDAQPRRILREPARAESLPKEVRDLVEQAKKRFEDKDYAEAENIYRRILRKTPNSYLALSNLGAVQIEGGKLSDAEVALKRAVKIKRNDSYAYTNLGIAYSRQGKFGEAIGVLHQAIGFNEGDAVAHNYLGVCLGQQEQWNEAEAQLKKAIELKPEYSDAHFNLAVLYATTQPPSLQLAKEHYVKATALGAAPDASLERLIQ
jgi:Flp pilus assembly protein TadD